MLRLAGSRLRLKQRLFTFTELNVISKTKPSKSVHMVGMKRIAPVSDPKFVNSRKFVVELLTATSIPVDEKQ